MAAVGLALIIARANVAGMLLARVGAATRDQRFDWRLALIAIIIRQLLTESLRSGARRACRRAVVVWLIRVPSSLQFPILSR
jgi:hypothetical protein